ncbi:MAG TPA: hypothetical protein VK550_36380 [Polyangiaceae bacterium]|nr:hypothetical protein [Polyangiaceae bacterium]
MRGVRAELVDMKANTAGRPIGVTAARRAQALGAARRKRQVWWWLLVGCVGCRAAAPLPPPEPPPAPPPPPVVEVPPPPKCEKVEEACVAGAETRARIAQAGWQFAPPASWVYAQGEEVTIATGKNAVMGVGVNPIVDVKKERGEREEALRRMAGQIGVTLPKKKSFIPKKPDKKQKVGEVNVDLYQIEGAKLDGRLGPLIFFVARSSNAQVLVGLGFVSDEDNDNSDQAIMGAIESLGPTAADPAADSKKAP